MCNTSTKNEKTSNTVEKTSPGGILLSENIG
jgi:hypothetical protein